jgi:lipopolysaccharide export system protein LptA
MLAGFACAMTLASVLSGPVAAQTVTNAFGGLSESSKDPIDIESDLLVVHDKEKYATFSGNVKAVQGTTTLRARELNVHYVGGDKLAPGVKKEETSQPAPATQTADAQAGNKQGTDKQGGDKKDNDTQITKIVAKGDVVIVSKDDQTTTSDWAIYDLPAQQVTVGGNVVLTQGKNVLKGDRLVIDLKTGESRFENTGNTAAGGRIRALFVPKKAEKAMEANGGASGAKTGGATPGDETSKSSKPDGAGASIGNETPDVPMPLTPDAMR